jgi:CBS domain-containing protein
VKVKEIMQTEFVHSIVPGTRETVLELMAKHGTNTIPLLKKGSKELAGMITRADLMQRAEEEQLALLMRRDPPTVSPSDKVEDIAHIFLDQGLRKIPVTDGKRRLKGMITVHQVIRKVISTLYPDELITPFVKRRIACIWENTPLRAAYAVMRLAVADMLPVLSEKGDLVGVISVGDIMGLGEIVSERRLSSMSAAGEGTDWSWDATAVLYIATKELQLPDKIVSEVMIHGAVTTFEQATIGEVIKNMRRHNINQMPVTTAKGELCGIIRDADLLRVFKRSE